MITNTQIRETLIPESVRYYLHKKLCPIAPKDIDIRTEELVKYLNMSVHLHGGIPFNEEIDDVWHYWIMETKEYFSLCEKMPGNGYIHHSSNDYQEYVNRDIKSEKPDFDHLLNVLVVYVLNYGPFEVDRIRYWPLAEKLMGNFKWNANQLNKWLQEILENNTSLQSGT